jgi:hypothetical protein
MIILEEGLDWKLGFEIVGHEGRELVLKEFHPTT